MKLVKVRFKVLQLGNNEPSTIIRPLFMPTDISNKEQHEKIFDYYYAKIVNAETVETYDYDIMEVQNLSGGFCKQYKSNKMKVQVSD